MLKILQTPSGTQYGTAEFFVEEEGIEHKGQLMFRILNGKLDVLDPFGGTNAKAYQTLTSLLSMQLPKLPSSS